jgi:hypothetical protein
MATTPVRATSTRPTGNSIQEIRYARMSAGGGSAARSFEVVATLFRNLGAFILEALHQLV